MSRDRRQRRAARRAGLLAIGSAAMIAVALTAAFAPFPGKHPATATAAPRAQPPPTDTSLHPVKSPWPSPSPTPTPLPVAAPAPGSTTTLPAPTPHSYPAPIKTYPAPSPRTFPPPPPSSTPPPGSDLPPPVPQSVPLEGVITDNVATWNADTQSRAELAGRFVSMARPLPSTWLHSLMRVSAGAEPVIEVTPTAPGQPVVTLADITAGKRDGWLANLRAQIDALGRPVVISFAPEANGDWYSWGRDPAGLVAAWHHVHSVLGTAGITWLWQVSAVADPTGLRPYWPGPAEVDWVGLDGYYYFGWNTFAQRFQASLTEVGGFWSGQVLIAESAVSPNVGDGAAMASKITDLFAGVGGCQHCIGLVYFNLRPTGGGFYHPDFRLERYPAALAAYTKAVNGSW